MSKERAIINIKQAIIVLDVLELSLNAYEERDRMAIERLNKALKELEEE